MSLCEVFHLFTIDLFYHKTPIEAWILACFEKFDNGAEIL